MDRIELLYDTGSPYSLVAYHVLIKLRQKWDIDLVLRPIALGMLFKVSGNDFSVGKSAAKQKYAHEDLRRTADLHHIKGLVIMPSRFPTSSLQAQRILTAIKQQHGDGELLHNASLAIWNAYWVRLLCTLGVPHMFPTATQPGHCPTSRAARGAVHLHGRCHSNPLGQPRLQAGRRQRRPRGHHPARRRRWRVWCPHHARQPRCRWPH